MASLSTYSYSWDEFKASGCRTKL